MKAKELRLGNKVLYNGKERKVEGILKRYVYLKAIKNEISKVLHSGLRPIPLTNEALIKAGFEKRVNGDYETFTHPDYKFVFIEKIGDHYLISGGYKTKKLHFVHELQNTHFYLFDKELKKNCKNEDTNRSTGVETHPNVL